MFQKEVQHHPMIYLNTWSTLLLYHSIRYLATQLEMSSYGPNGTVAASIPYIDFHQKRDASEKYFDDGTLHFVSIASLKHGLLFSMHINYVCYLQVCQKFPPQS